MATKVQDFRTRNVDLHRETTQATPERGGQRFHAARFSSSVNESMVLDRGNRSCPRPEAVQKASNSPKSRWLGCSLTSLTLGNNTMDGVTLGDQGLQYTLSRTRNTVSWPLWTGRGTCAEALSGRSSSSAART